ncbi:MAG: hypothetical protein QGG42_21045 [Phycisphaerae bacterium]|jgi:WD40 repeat protein|nr:hypothetical protein [Phycisphaerae bacterium]
MKVLARTVFVAVWLSGEACGLFAAAPTEGGAADFHGDPLPHGAVRRYGTVRFRTGRPIRGLSFSPTGKSIASSDGARIVLWSYPQGRRIWEIDGDLPPGRAFSSDGKLLIVREMAKDPAVLLGRRQTPCVAVRIVDAASGKVLRTVRPTVSDKEYPMSMAWQPGGTTLAVGWFSGAIDLIDGLTGRKLARLDAPSWPERADKRAPRPDLPEKMRRAMEKRERENRILRPALKVTLSADGKTAVALYRPSYETFVIWDLAKRTVRFMSKPMGCSVPAITLSPDGQTFRAAFEIGSPDKPNIQSCDVSSETDLKSAFKLWAQHTGAAIDEHAVFSADGLLMAQSARWSSSKPLWVGETTVLLADSASGKTTPLERKLVGSQALAISPAGKVLATGGAAQVIRFWDTATGKPTGDVSEPNGPVLSIAVCPNERLLAMGCADGKVRIRRITDGKAIAELQGSGGPIRALVFLPDGKTLVGLSPDKKSRMSTQLWFWDYRRGSTLTNVRVPLGSGPLARTRDGRYVAYTRGATISVVDTVARSVVKHPYGDYVGEFASGLRFSVSMTGGYTNATTLTGWPSLSEKTSRGQRGERMPFFCAAFAPDGLRILAGKTNSLALVESATGKTVRQFAPAAGFDSRRAVPWFRHAAITPDGKRAVAVQDTEPYVAGRTRTYQGQAVGDKVIRTWDVASARELSSFRGHRGHISAIAFAEGGRALLTAGNDSTVLLWDLNQRKVAATLPSDPKSLAPIVVGMDGSLAIRAMRSVCEKPEASIGVVNAWLAAEPKNAEIAPLIADLGQDDLVRRVAAMRKLGLLRGTQAAVLEIALLRTVLDDETPEPVRNRVRSLLHPLRSRASGPLVELTRLIKLLEWTGDAKAVERLRQWGQRLPVLRGGGEVKSALGRIKAGSHREDLKALPPVSGSEPSDTPTKKLKLLTKTLDSPAAPAEVAPRKPAGPVNLPATPSSN